MPVISHLYRPLRERALYRESAYHLIGLVTGIMWFVLAVTLYAVGIALTVVWIGLPLVVGTHRAMRWIAAVERWQVRTMLGAATPHVPPLTVPVSPWRDSSGRPDFVAWMRAVFTDAYSWSALGWVSIRLVTGPLGFAFALTAWVTMLTLILLPVALLFPGLEYDGPLAGLAWTATFGPVAAVLVAPLFAWGLRGWAVAHRVLARALLGPRQEDVARAATQRAERAEQQVRIDQELHDSIGHMITMNIVQAGAGAHVFDSDPEFARQALVNIQERGRVAMAELDRIIAAIHGSDPGPRSPLPSAEQIPDLVESSRAAGMSIDAVLTSATVPAALGRAAYGIVREAVTNAAKHAPGALVHVHVELRLDTLCVAITNGPPVNKSPEPSHHSVALDDRVGIRHGLAGIKDRVLLLGGRSETGPTADDGFMVLALLPTGMTLVVPVPVPRDTCCAWSRLWASVDA